MSEARGERDRPGARTDAGTDAISRRALLAGAAGVGGAALVGCRAGADDLSSPTAATVVDAPMPSYREYFGDHQAGVTAPPQPSGTVAAYDVDAADREQLRALFTGLSNESARLTTGLPYEEPDGSRPPAQAGTVGNPPPPADLTITVALGSTFFDDRFGFADERPRDLDPMPSFPGDQLDPSRTGGDLLILVGSSDPAMDRFALRQLHRATHGFLRPRWSLDTTRTSTRNLLGFVDQISNPDTADPLAMDRIVWVGAGDDEPSWTTGGTYAVLRATRLLLEDWDSATLDHQEHTIGRRRDSGSPLGTSTSDGRPDFERDPDGAVTPLDAHIRLANPGTPETADQRILRRGADYARGFDPEGRLDQGLLFLSYQRSIRDQFAPIQARLEGEPLARYARAEGGGHWFVLPGVADHDRYLADTLIEG